MPIQLATPFNPGDTDPGVTYTHAMIREFRTFIGPNEVPDRVEIVVAYGVHDNGTFTEGYNARRKVVIENQPAVIRPAQPANPPAIPDPIPEMEISPAVTDLTDMLLELAAENETVYGAVGRLLYTHLIMKGLYVGAPV